MRRRRRRGEHRPAARPSERAAERLRRDVNREVADLRLQLEEASLRSDAYLQAGYAEEAAEVVDEQRRLLSRFEDRLRRSMSEAAVEAEAERVLAGVPGAEALSDAPAAEPDPAAARVTPALVSAAVAALLAIVAVASPGPDGTQLSSAESPSRSDAPPVALGDEAGSDRPSSRAAAPGPPAPTSRSAFRNAGGAAHTDAPRPTSTERLVGLIGGFVDATGDVIRDALRALLDDGRLPAIASGDGGKLGDTTPTDRPSVSSSTVGDEADDGDASSPDDRSSEDTGAAEQGGQEGQENQDDQEGSGDSEQDGSLSGVPGPVPGGASPYEG